MNRSTHIQAQPEFPWLNVDEPAEVEALLHRLGWLDDDECITTCERAGEGNMNLTLRLKTTQRTVVLKQARPWVEKYDHIAAPWDRIIFEYRFYRRAREIEGVSEYLPAVLGFDGPTRVMLLEFLPGARDFTDVYLGTAASAPTAREIDRLATFARTLHDATQRQPDPAFANREMRALNHEHSYQLPLREDNGLDLDAFEPGLSTAARELQRDAHYVALTHETGERYLADGQCLLHGDYFPGSWLRTDSGPRIIDAEFCYYGDREFDIACAAAHMILAGQPQLAQRFIEAYGRDILNEHWLSRYVAAEVMRRLIGVAQLPLTLPTGQRAALLLASRQAMLNQSLEPLCEFSSKH